MKLPIKLYNYKYCLMEDKNDDGCPYFESHGIGSLKGYCGLYKSNIKYGDGSKWMRWNRLERCIKKYGK